MHFLNRFKFNPEKHLYIGIERECFLTNRDIIVPIADRVLDKIGINGEYGYELSACQLEIRTKPIQISDVLTTLSEADDRLKNLQIRHDFGTLHTEVAPENIPLNVYPDPSGRYQRITAQMPEHILRAACMVAGTHIHVGMKDAHTALRVYNEVIRHLRLLCRIGDKSKGKRLQIYSVMAPNYLPQAYKNWAEYEAYALEQGFHTDPRSCWHLIRMSVHGTLEFRMFGATSDIQEIADWALLCHDLCKSAL